MNPTLQRTIVFFIIMLPLTFNQVKRWWYLIVLWVGVLILIHFIAINFLKNNVDKLNNITYTPHYE